jgi:DNA-binding CsgD family transcriptional regulator
MTSIESRRAEIKRLFDEGLKPAEIGQTLGLSIVTVHNDLRAVELKDLNPRKSADELAATLREVMESLSLLHDASDVKSYEPETRSEIIRGLSERGLKPGEMTKLTGLTYVQLKRAADRVGISIVKPCMVSTRATSKEKRAAPERVKPKKAEIVAQRRAEVKRLVLEGKSASEIAVLMKCPTSVVYNDMKVLGVASLKPKPVDDERNIKRITELAMAGLTVSAIVRASGIAAHVVNDVVKKHGIAVSRKSKTHGLVSTYRSGCKCEPCFTAGKAYDLECKRVRYATKVKPEHVHGTVGGAKNWGCDCERCVEAVRISNKVSASLPAPAEKKFDRWTPEEEAVISDRSITAREAAIKIGRTVSSVNSRRSYLNGQKSD